MCSRARIATVALNGRLQPTIEANRESVLNLLDRALQAGPDLVCLPEAFHDAGVPALPGATAETLDGPTVEAVARRARASHSYIVCPIHTVESGCVYNSAVLIGRDGSVRGVYHKRCPVTSSHDYTVLEDGVTPGDSLPVFDLDFGRVGVQICFDIGFPENWRELADRGARLVLWPSAYDGGFALRVHAFAHHYYVISSTRSGRSRIVDPCGETLQETSADEPIAWRDVNLDYLVYHWDWNMGVADRIREVYGSRVDVRAWDPGSAHAIVEPVDPAITCERLQHEFGIESVGQYHARHRTAYAAIRAGRRPEPQNALHGKRPQWGG